MPEKFASKLFYSNAEAAARKPSDEEIERTRSQLEAFNTELRAAGPSSDGHVGGLGGRFSDDLSGTEFQGWTLEDGTWRDANGQVVYTEGPDGGWYDAAGHLVFDALGNRPQ
ncbi:hypothetical protein AB0M45_30225 [Nocardia sp. NPDC051787]|uniref:hypothetical protein n=1 Tax=Nocardia sp. NPDC051787 TaxID=3155415 RepID=UPI003420C90D